MYDQFGSRLNIDNHQLWSAVMHAAYPLIKTQGGSLRVQPRHSGVNTDIGLPREGEPIGYTSLPPAAPANSAPPPEGSR